MNEKYSFETRNVISCKDYAQKMKNEMKAFTDELNDKPVLVIIQVGDNPASNSYIKGKVKDCEEVGIEHVHKHFPEDVAKEELIGCIQAYNYSESVNGIILQLPLPEHLNADEITCYIDREKDVDGFVEGSLFDPCTPKGIIDWLEYNNFNFTETDAVVIGRSKIVGKPLVNMLIDKGATVTCCNSKTRTLPDYTRYADLIISAIGKPKYFNEKDFNFAEVIVDVGINRDENGKLCGDVDRESIVNYMDTYVTPVPGGVGLLTRCSLMQNVIEAYKVQKGYK